MKLSIPDERMLALMQWAISKGIANTETEYLEKIGFPRSNISNIRRGHQVFTRDYIIKACNVTGANANWIFGLESKMLRQPAASAIELLKTAVVAVEEEMNSKKIGVTQKVTPRR